MEKPIRVLVAKPGLDGHDRGAKVIARALRDAGMEVIYTGLRQTPEQIVAAAIQEDVQVVALSILSGAHNHLLPKVVELLKVEDAYDETLVIGGGVIPDEDIPFLKESGIEEIFTPGTSTEVTINFIKNNLKEIVLYKVKLGGVTVDLGDRLLNGDKRAAARLITMFENRDKEAIDLLIKLYKHTGRARIIGITGPPGSGKSTLTDKLAKALRKEGKKIGIIAVDPTSPFTGGSILGDRVRMSDLYTDSEVFIRSMGTRGHLGGLSKSTLGAIKILDICGYDYIFVETVGVGQSEVDIVKASDTTLMVMVPGLGDDIQAIKAGVMEIGDVFTINKADRDGAERTKVEIEMALDFSNAEWRPPVTEVAALYNKGTDDLITELKGHWEYLETSGQLLNRRIENSKSEIVNLTKQTLMQKIFSDERNVEDLQFLSEEVASRRVDPYSASKQIMKNIKF